VTVDTLVTGGSLVRPGRRAEAVDIAIADGRISGVFGPGSGIEAARRIDATGLHVFPGLIDAHVHFGFAEPITEYSTETAYAAQGGFCTAVGYLLNNKGYGQIARAEIGHAESRAHVDYAFHFCTANETHLDELSAYVRDFGVTSFKYFMNFRGDEGLYLGLDGTDDGYLFDLLKKAAGLDAIVVVHTENIEIVNRIRRDMQSSGRASLRDWSLSKPPFTEAENIVRAAYFAEHHGATIYIPHLSSALALDEVRRWRARHDKIVVETCPHYLTHTSDSDVGPIGKANPPFRERSDVDALWAGLADGSIDVVASDHVPRKRATKDKPIWQASQGFPGTATILPVLLDQGYHRGRLDLPRIAELLARNPARVFGLPTKGDVAPGMDADLTLVDLERVRVVRSAELGSWSDYSLYDGWSFRGWPTATIVRGIPVMVDGEIVGPPGHGTYLRRSAGVGSPHATLNGAP